jgi:hypothetical protein
MISDLGRHRLPRHRVHVRGRVIIPRSSLLVRRSIHVYQCLCYWKITYEATFPCGDYILVAPMDNQTQLATETDDILRHIDNLQVLAFDAYSPLPGRAFVPKVSLREYLSHDKVKTLLKFCGLSVVDWHTIHTHYLTVFVILLGIGKGKYITHFRSHDALADDQLPFHTGSNWPSVCLKFYDKFDDAQWRFCAQELRADRLDDRMFLWKRIIPITSKTMLKDSADSETYRVEIHPDYAPKVGSSSCLPISNANSYHPDLPRPT